jgi:hypothetical protein
MDTADPARAWFAWRHYHPHLAEDPQAVWGAAWKAGGRAALHDSSRLAGLGQLLTELLYLLEDGTVELELRNAVRFDEVGSGSSV